MTETTEKNFAPCQKCDDQEAPYWGKIIVDILKNLLEFNQLTWGIKKKF